ncbi:hypothetical protein ABNX05_11730 [Lysinibacillus sp. M3]|uniref:DUF5659 domain-containing protein n=2 Tax=Lysinibacillus zambalensis TaxID=3160866 RepID=A0ABV1MS12_9BACI
MKKDYIVMTQRLAGTLMQNGFVLQKLKPSNKNGIKRNVFIFNESEQLINFIHNYKSTK